jgi:Domain of unknown function (DUF4062)
MKVFISSTIHDLKDLRDSLQQWLEGRGYTVLASEAGTIPVDSSKHSYAVCLEAARDCDCLVAIIDGRFGGVMRDGSKRSITLAEIQEAFDHGRRVWVFVRQSVWDAKEVYNRYTAAGVPFQPSNIVNDERVFHLIDDIRRRKTGNWLLTFNLPTDLIDKLQVQLEAVVSAGTAAVPEEPHPELTAAVPDEPHPELTADEKRLLLYCLVNETGLRVYSNAYEMPCVRAPLQYFGYEYTAQAHELTRDEDQPKVATPEQHDERLRWMSALARLKHKELLGKPEPEVWWVPTQAGRDAAESVLAWRVVHAPSSVPVPSMLERSVTYFWDVA